MISFVSGLSRDEREKILGGAKDKVIPPVGVYSPKYNAVEGNPAKGYIKFDGSKARLKDSLLNIESSMSLSHAPQPSI